MPTRPSAGCAKGGSARPRQNSKCGTSSGERTILAGRFEDGTSDHESFLKLERVEGSRDGGHSSQGQEMSKTAGRTGTVKVFIADGSRMSCQLIAAALRRGRYRTRVVGYAIDGNGIREGLNESEADVAVIGARLEEEALAGFDVTRQIRALHSKPFVVMLLDSSKPTMVVEAFRAGARGVFSRDQSSELLCKCIHAVHQGQIWASSKELHFVLEALGTALPTKAIFPRGSGLLTKREEGVVDLVAEGLTNRDISQQLNLSVHTVRNYLFRIFNKVGTSNRLELALYAINRREPDSQQISLAAIAAPRIDASQAMAASRS
jgi:DNA-binding NarL/FixJ family response regulator